MIKRIYDWLIKNVDKQLHLLWSCLITILACSWMGWLGLIFPISAGLLKEVYDEFSYGGFSWEDILADIIGTMLGILAWMVI